MISTGVPDPLELMSELLALTTREDSLEDAECVELRSRNRPGSASFKTRPSNPFRNGRIQ